ncbi:MAG: hypothetical protein Tsb0018_03460 [Opitutales bacterium]
MKVICRCNIGSGLPSSYYELGYTNQTKFNIQVGKSYWIYGISLWRNETLHYLIADEDEHFDYPYYDPTWKPAVLFDIESGKLPRRWYFRKFKEDPEFPLLALWGYDELVNSNDRSHYIGLIEREVEHLKIFQERKKEIDAEYAEEG